MGTLFLEFRGYILDRLLDLLWRQWSALGVPGRTTIEERRVVDPESLLLISLTVGRYDARLFDEILDWLVVCELFCLLAAAEEIHPADAARQTGYSPRTVQNTLAEMSRSGVVQMRSGNRDKWYALNSGVLDLLLKPEGSPTPWVNWAPLFRALEILWIGIIDPKRQNLDPLTLASELRRLGKEMRPLLADAGWGGRQFEDDSSFRGAEYSAVFIRNIKGILNQ